MIATKAAPPLSVLMPVHNGEEFLGEAIDSILAQSFADFEFVIIDDNSSDSSADILREYERKDERLRVYRRPKGGVVRSLNFGLAACRSELVARMDADDVAYADRFAVQVEAMRRRRDVLVIGGAYDLTDSNGRMLRRHWPPEDNAALQAMCLDGQTPIGHPTVVMRRSAVYAVGGYDEALEWAEDIDLWLRLGERGRTACVRHPVLRYRQHEKSVSEQRAVEQADRIRIACERAYERRGLTRTFRPPPAWRPTGEDAKYQFMLTYGWWAFNSAERQTAISYGVRAVQRRPLDMRSWSLLYASVLKHVPEPADRDAPHALEADLPEPTARAA